MYKFRSVIFPLALISTLFLAPAALAQFDARDPWEPMNRKLYSFNATLDDYVIRPVAKGYAKVMPGFARTGVKNFFNNLDDVNVLINDLLQLKLDSAMNDSGRLLVNTTVGVGGLFDVATKAGLYKNNEDFGQTMGAWGLNSGPYLVVPFVGNSTLRDTIAMIPDAFLNPIFWVSDTRVRTGLYALERIDTRVTYFGADELTTGDEYLYARDATLQRREYLVNDGEAEDNWDDWDDWEE